MKISLDEQICLDDLEIDGLDMTVTLDCEVSPHILEVEKVGLSEADEKFIVQVVKEAIKAHFTEKLEAREIWEKEKEWQEAQDAEAWREQKLLGEDEC